MEVQDMCDYISVASTLRRWWGAVRRSSMLWLLIGVMGSTLGAIPLAYGHAPDADVNADLDLDPATGTPVSIRGTLHVVHADDFARQRSRFYYHLEDEATGERFQVFFGRMSTHHLRTGDKIHIRGKAHGREVTVAAAEGGSLQVLTAAATAAASGAQQTLVLVANFQDASVSCPLTTIRDRMFTDPSNKSIDDFYQEASFGQLSFVGDAYGPYPIDYSTTSPCDYYAWAGAAEAQAQANGVNVGAYTRKVYVLPQTNSCGYAGLGTIGGNPSRSWIFRCDLPDVFGHELGHNIAAHHAATPSYEYGDTSDIMGYSGVGLRHMNAPHKEALGWLPAGQVQMVSQNGTYTVAPLELPPLNTTAPQVLKIAKPDTNEYYYLSYRRPLGFDTILSASYSDKVNVHRYPGSGSVFTYFLQALTDSTSFSDTINGITMTQTSHDATTATVQVAFVCMPAKPVVSLSPTSKSTQAGGTVSYAMSVTNKDSAGCAPSTLSLLSSVPAGWSGSLSPTSVSLSPGASATATFTVVTPAGSANGTFSVSGNVFESLVASHTASASAVTIVDSTPPTAPTNLKAALKSNQVRLTWSASTDNVGVSSYAILRDGVRIGTTTTTIYSDGTTKRGKLYTYTVNASDAVGNISALSNAIQIQR